MNWSSCGWHIYLARSKGLPWICCDLPGPPASPSLTFSREWFIHLLHAEYLKGLCLNFWQQVISFPSVRSVWCYLPLFTADITKNSNLFSLTGKWNHLWNYCQEAVSFRNTEVRVVTVGFVFKSGFRQMHEVHFQGCNNYDLKFVQIVSFRSSFKCIGVRWLSIKTNTTDKVSSARCRMPCARWPWRLRHLPPSSAVEGSAAAGWCLSATSTGQEGPLKKTTKKQNKTKLLWQIKVPPAIVRIVWREMKRWQEITV